MPGQTPQNVVYLDGQPQAARDVMCALKSAGCPDWAVYTYMATAKFAKKLNPADWDLIEIKHGKKAGEARLRHKTNRKRYMPVPDDWGQDEQGRATEHVDLDRYEQYWKGQPHEALQTEQHRLSEAYRGGEYTIMPSGITYQHHLEPYADVVRHIISAKPPDQRPGTLESLTASADLSNPVHCAMLADAYEEAGRHEEAGDLRLGPCLRRPSGKVVAAPIFTPDTTGVMHDTYSLRGSLHKAIQTFVNDKPAGVDVDKDLIRGSYTPNASNVVSGIGGIADELPSRVLDRMAMSLSEKSYAELDEFTASGYGKSQFCIACAKLCDALGNSRETAECRGHAAAIASYRS